MKIKVTIDPLKRFTNISKNDIVESCGMLPFWVINEKYNRITLKSAMELQYDFGPLYKMEGGIIDGDGIYQYPNDPPQYPLIKIERDDEIFFQYLYAVVAFINGEETFVTRMD